MEDYGIGPALKMAALTFMQASRRSGRTSRLIERALDGDWIIVGKDEESRRLEIRLREAGKKGVRVRRFSPSYDGVQRLIQNRPADGMVHFDHSWLEQYWLNEHAVIQAELAKAVGHLSGRPQGRALEPMSINFEAWKFRDAP
ncbi:MAG: hypothetical protein U9R64_10270 [Pseudomonadota bacterium]|nr:hypothetical protein [Pseudomonadota bacterium]